MLNREDIKSKLYLKPLSNDLEIKVAESLIERIKKLEINEEIVELKKRTYCQSWKQNGKW